MADAKQIQQDTFTPANYTPTAGSGFAANTTTGNLAGIDAALAAAGGTTNTETPTAVVTPDPGAPGADAAQCIAGFVPSITARAGTQAQIKVNGIEYLTDNTGGVAQPDGTTVVYFSDDGGATSILPQFATPGVTSLFWNGNTANFAIAASDSITVFYFT